MGNVLNKLLGRKGDKLDRYIINKIHRITSRTISFNFPFLDQLKKQDEERFMVQVLNCIMNRPKGAGQFSSFNVNFKNYELESYCKFIINALTRHQPEMLQSLRDKSPLVTQFGALWPDCEERLNDAVKPGVFMQSVQQMLNDNRTMMEPLWNSFAKFQRDLQNAGAGRNNVALPNIPGLAAYLAGQFEIAMSEIELYFKMPVAAMNQSAIFCTLAANENIIVRSHIVTKPVKAKINYTDPSPFEGLEHCKKYNPREIQLSLGVTTLGQLGEIVEFPQPIKPFFVKEDNTPIVPLELFRLSTEEFCKVIFVFQPFPARAADGSLATVTHKVNLVEDYRAHV